MLLRLLKIGLNKFTNKNFPIKAFSSNCLISGNFSFIKIEISLHIHFTE